MEKAEALAKLARLADTLDGTRAIERDILALRRSLWRERIAAGDSSKAELGRASRVDGMTVFFDLKKERVG